VIDRKASHPSSLELTNSRLTKARLASKIRNLNYLIKNGTLIRAGERCHSRHYLSKYQNDRVVSS
jgi:hypothetical protein